MPWLTTLLGAVITKVFQWFLGFFAYRVARQLALSTGLIIIIAAIFVGVVIAVKAAVMGARVVMPPVLANATYFLPSNLPTIIGSIVSIRTSLVVYRWTMTNLSVYARLGDPYLGVKGY